MKNPVIKRYISDNKAFETIKNDFGFLVKKIKDSGFEYDLQIRDGYFNLYYKGNSIGKISYKKTQKKYEVRIHQRFIDDKIKKRFSPVYKNSYLTFKITSKQLHPLFSSQNLNSMANEVKKVDFQEEVIFEQMLMTDNIDREDLIIIDRQVMDKISKTKMDLVALKKKENNDYQFCVIEVKLGNNPELKGNVISQLKDYIERIEDHFDDYKKCYEQNFKQKQEMGLFDKPDDINIVRDVIGVVVVMGYSGIAKQSIKKLEQKDSSIKVIQLSNRLDLKKLN
jgi:hypothetical protein